MAPTQTRSRSLPENPNEEYLRKEAKRLARDEAIQLAAAQRRLAREYGFSSWTELIGHVKSVSAASKGAHGPDAVAQQRSTLNELLKRPLYELPLSRRAFAGLQHENVRYVGELIQRTEHDLLEIKNFGRKSLNEIKKVLAEMGISLGMRLEVEKALPFLPLRGLIAFPHVVYPVFVGRRMSINAIKSAENRKIPIAMAAQKDPKIKNPGDADIYRTGVVGTLIKVEELPDGTLKALIEGKRRVRVSHLNADGEFLEAKTEELTEPATDGVEKLLESVASAFVSGHFKSLTTNRSVFLSARSNPSAIADRVASHLPIEISEKQALLELLNPAERLEKLVIHLKRAELKGGKAMEDLNAVRRQYAELIQQRANLRSERLVNALSEVPREHYLGPGPWKIMRSVFPLKYEDTPDANPAVIYDDVLVALDAGRSLNNGLPSGNARWLDTMDIQPGEHVVHAGCGTGYYTALIAHIVTASGRVTAIEFDPALADRARTNLGRYSQVKVIAGDATKFDSGPTDAIFVNAGATHPCPLWLDSLKLSGRLVFPMIRWPQGSVMGVGVAGWGVMMKIERMRTGFAARWLGPCGFFPCFGAIDSEADRRLGDTLAKNGLTEVRSLRREAHSPDGWCLLHGDGYCFSRLDL